MSYLLIWIIGVLGVMTVGSLILWLTKVNVEQFGHFGQGLGGLGAAVAILLGGALFIAEGRAQPRLLLQITSTVVPASPGAGEHDLVYVQIVTTIENRGQISPATIECAAFDAFGLSPAASRNDRHGNDLDLPSLLRDEDSHGPVWEECLAREAEEGGEDHVRADSGFRWLPFEIRPGQIKTRNFELLVPCTLSGLRVLVKIPDPEGGVLERKLAVSILDVCRGVSSRTVTTISDPGSSPTDDSEPPSAPAPAETPPETNATALTSH